MIQHPFSSTSRIMHTKLHIEIVKTKRGQCSSEARDIVWNYISGTPPAGLKVGEIVRCQNVLGLSDHIHSFTICSDLAKWPVPFEDVVFHIYALTESGQNVLDITDSDAESVTTSNHWMLPNAEFHGLWESLIYDEGIKENLLKYVETIMHFSNQSIDSNLISCNRLVLLHGPPGTGKTSLSKAIAQKLSIRFNEKYSFIHLVEINSHSLFSKWFSESGKLVMKLFAQIREIVEHQQSLVCILIDEIESIAFERNSISSSEPSDSLRVVNAVLTQLDQIRKFSNVLILTTSNLTSAIDFAFLDRADIRQFIGPPNSDAIAKIYRTILDELVCRQVVTKDDSLSDEAFEGKLKQLAEASVGISGRTLRKIPILAHAFYTDHSFDGGSQAIPLSVFMESMSNAIAKYTNDSRHIKSPVIDKDAK